MRNFFFFVLGFISSLVSIHFFPDENFSKDGFEDLAIACQNAHYFHQATSLENNLADTSDPIFVKINSELELLEKIDFFDKCIIKYEGTVESKLNLINWMSEEALELSDYYGTFVAMECLDVGIERNSKIVYGDKPIIFEIYLQKNHLDVTIENIKNTKFSQEEGFYFIPIESEE